VGVLRQLLFSRWFFGVLVIVLVLDIISDITEHFWPQEYQLLNYVAIALDAVGLVLALWMFIDLSLRRPTNGNHPRRG
jgi:hypothetical protein